MAVLLQTIAGSFPHEYVIKEGNKYEKYYDYPQLGAKRRSLG
jgi:hypothetical protein